MFTETNGVFLGTTLMQKRGNIGGARHVFVKLSGNKNDLVHPPIGGRIVNAPKGAFRAYAGDLVEYRYKDGVDNANGAVCYLLKTYLIHKANEDAVYYFVRDGYKHIPFVGDVLMIAPDAVGTKGTAKTIIKVEETTDGGKNVWKVTFDATLGEVSEGDVLVEADAAGDSTANMLVKNPNMCLPCDYDFVYTPSTGSEDFDGARYFFTPVMHMTAYIERMSPMPDCIKAINKSRVDGWFEL